MRGGWFYRRGANRVGPIPLHALQNLIRSGQLGSNVEVWTQSMPQWVPAFSLPLFNPGAHARPHVRAQQGIRPLHVVGMIVAGIVGVAVVTGSSANKDHQSDPQGAARSAAPKTSGVSDANTGNRANDLFMGLSESDQLGYMSMNIGKAYGPCDANRIYYRGISIKDHTAYWSVGCRRGSSYAVSVEANDTGSSTVADCTVLKAVMGDDCFTPLDAPAPKRSTAQIRAEIETLPPKVKQQAMAMFETNLREATTQSDEGQACSVNGIAGVCIAVSACSGTHTANYCPHSGDNVQCCTTAAPVLRSEAVAPEGLACCDGTMSPSCTCGGSHRGCCSHHGGVCGCR